MSYRHSGRTPAGKLMVSFFLLIKMNNTNSTNSDIPENFTINYNMFIMILTLCNFVYGFGSAIYKFITNGRLKNQTNNIEGVQRNISHIVRLLENYFVVEGKYNSVNNMAKSLIVDDILNKIETNKNIEEDIKKKIGTNKNIEEDIDKKIGIKSTYPPKKQLSLEVKASSKPDIL